MWICACTAFRWKSKLSGTTRSLLNNWTFHDFGSSWSHIFVLMRFLTWSFYPGVCTDPLNLVWKLKLRTKNQESAVWPRRKWRRCNCKINCFKFPISRVSASVLLQHHELSLSSRSRSTLNNRWSIFFPFGDYLWEIPYAAKTVSVLVLWISRRLVLEQH